MLPSASDTLAKSEKATEPSGNVPYAAATDNEFALGSCFAGTRLGTVASFAVDHAIASRFEQQRRETRPKTVSTNGRNDEHERARPTSHATITRRRSSRSSNTPAIGPRKNPGSSRAERTKATAVSPEPFETRVAQRDDREEADPVAEARDERREPDPPERRIRETPRRAGFAARPRIED